jgi:hypothetical protein
MVTVGNLSVAAGNKLVTDGNREKAIRYSRYSLGIVDFVI